MITRVRSLFGLWLNKRRLARELKPERFRQMVEELNELAHMASRLRRKAAGDALSMDEVRRDLDALARRIEDPAFGRLPVERRRELKDGLDRSREAVLQAIQGSDPPTTYLQ